MTGSLADAVIAAAQMIEGRSKRSPDERAISGFC
jgi:hypothetical protein